MTESVTSAEVEGRGRSVRLVPFLFGVADRIERRDLPGPVLVRLLGDLGLSTQAARALIARMRRDGQLAATRSGRTVSYRLIGGFADAFERIRTAAEGPSWPGYFHALLYQVPESHRPFRDLLRRTAQFAGYGLLQAGVLIGTSDRRALLHSVLAQRPPDTTIYFGQLHLDRSDAAAAAYAAWDLGELDRTYRAHIRTLQTALARRRTEPPPDGHSLRRFAELVSEPLVDSLRSSALPADLAPAGWSLPELRQAIDRLYALYLPPATAYLRRLLDRAGT